MILQTVLECRCSCGAEWVLSVGEGDPHAAITLPLAAADATCGQCGQAAVAFRAQVNRSDGFGPWLSPGAPANASDQSSAHPDTKGWRKVGDRFVGQIAIRLPFTVEAPAESPYGRFKLQATLEPWKHPMVMSKEAEYSALRGGGWETVNEHDIEADLLDALWSQYRHAANMFYRSGDEDQDDGTNSADGA
jgi:hypothetical protein